MKNPYQKAYENNRVLNASRGELVIMLYEGAIRFNENAIENMNFKTYDKVNHFISRSMDVIVELKTSLNLELGGEVAENLNNLYDYMLERLKIANKDKDKTTLEEVNTILKELLTSWKTIVKTETPGQNDRPRPIVPGSLDGFSIKG